MTSFLLKLLGARVDDAVQIAKTSLAFRGGIGLGWFIVLLLALGAVFVWIYRTGPPNLSLSRKATLAALRISFIALVLLLLMRPILSLTVEGSVRRLLVLLFDTSASMQIKDPRLAPDDQKRAAIALDVIDPAAGLAQNLDRSRLSQLEQVARMDVLKAALKNPRLNLLPRLDSEFDLDAFSFGQGVAPIAARKDAPTNGIAQPDSARISPDQFNWVEHLRATNPGTAIGDAIREVINRKRGQPLAGVVLVTDGANNSGSEPREAAALLRQEGVPLYTYGVGMTSPRDIIVGNIFAPEITFVKDEVTITVRVRSQGLKGESAQLMLKLDGQQVAGRTVNFSADGEQVVQMRFTPQKQGEFDLDASIEPRPDEAVKDNNSRTQRLRVIDAKIKVLLVDQAPRWEFRYLQAMLLRDRRIELKCFLVEGDPAIARGDNTPYIAQFPSKKEELFKYDLVIFGDVDPKSISPAQLENLNELVSKFGGALVMVAGRRFSPLAYRRTIMENLLPVEFDTPTLEPGRDAVADKPIHLELTAAGRASPMLRLSDNDEENIAVWKQLPPLYWVARVSRPKPAAEVLLVDPDPARESRFGKMPVIAAQQYGLGQVLYVGTDNTWRWRKNAGDLYYTALWGQIAQRVSIQRLLGGSKRTQLTTDRQNYRTGDRISIYARLYGPGFEPVQEPSVKGFFALRPTEGSPPPTTTTNTAAAPRNTATPEITLRPLPEQPGLYRAEFVAPAPGNYQFWVEPDANTLLDFNVTEPGFELGETAMNEGLLQEMASRTGGAYFREEDLYKLPETISLKTERVRSPLEVELWASPLYFLALIGVVTAEWILRKMSFLK
jgi:hypothetical protein